MTPLPSDTPSRPEPSTPLRDTIALLEPSQRAAVLADDPVVCVLAGAGTGKTRVLTLRVARRLDDRSAHPNHVLVCTFSRKAADELRDRLWRLGVGADVQAGTFHRSALRLISQHRSDRGMPPPVVTADRRSLLSTVVDGTEDATSARRGRRTRAETARRGRASRSGARGNVARLETEIGWAKSRLVGPADYEAAARASGRRSSVPPATVADVYARYEELRARRGVLDLDDLLLYCADLMEEDQTFARAVRWWHRHVFVDETQDLNEAQYRLLRQLVGNEPDLFVVGDPDQSVYGWNGADPGLLDRITDEFAGTRVLRLDTNHRCSPQIVRVAAAVLGRSGTTSPGSTRQDGPVPTLACLPTDADEARWVARQVWLAHRPGRRWSSIAVLSRTNAQLTNFSAALAGERVPHRIAGAELAPASDLDEREHSDEAGETHTPTGTGAHDAATGDGAGTGGHPDDVVVLSTFHRAKGLQWPAVFVVGLSDGIVPLVTARSAAAKAEERRLLYVALTRAEDELSCSWALHPDESAADAGGTPRSASPWIGAMEAAASELRDASAEASTESAAQHVARIRDLLSPAPADPGRMPK